MTDDYLKYILLKWADGQTWTIVEFDRFVEHLATVPIRLETENPDAVNSRFARFRQVLSERYINPPSNK